MPPPQPAANREGWGSLGSAPLEAKYKAPAHEPKKRTIFRPSKKAIPKLAGQTSIFDFCRIDKLPEVQDADAEQEEKEK